MRGEIDNGSFIDFQMLYSFLTSRNFLVAVVNKLWDLRFHFMSRLSLPNKFTFLLLRHKNRGNQFSQTLLKLGTPAPKQYSEMFDELAGSKTKKMWLEF